MQQRAISLEMINLALRLGRSYRSYGAKVYQLTDRSLADTPYQKQTDRLRGLTVVVQDGEIRTAYWDRALRKRGRFRRSRLLQRKKEKQERALRRYQAWWLDQFGPVI